MMKIIPALSKYCTNSGENMVKLQSFLALGMKWAEIVVGCRTKSRWKRLNKKSYNDKMHESMRACQLKFKLNYDQKCMVPHQTL